MEIIWSFWLVFGILFGIAAAIEAEKKGRSKISWFLGSLALGPFGLLYVILLPPIPPSLSDEQRDRAIQAGQDRADRQFKKGKML